MPVFRVLLLVVLAVSVLPVQSEDESNDVTGISCDKDAECVPVCAEKGGQYVPRCSFKLCLCWIP